VLKLFEWPTKINTLLELEDFIFQKKKLEKLLLVVWCCRQCDSYPHTRCLSRRLAGMELIQFPVFLIQTKKRKENRPNRPRRLGAHRSYPMRLTTCMHVFRRHANAMSLLELSDQAKTYTTRIKHPLRFSWRSMQVCVTLQTRIYAYAS
jgi:hypothetical protein